MIVFGGKVISERTFSTATCVVCFTVSCVYTLHHYILHYVNKTKSNNALHTRWWTTTSPTSFFLFQNYSKNFKYVNEYKMQRSRSFHRYFSPYAFSSMDIFTFFLLLNRVSRVGSLNTFIFERNVLYQLF